MRTIRFENNHGQKVLATKMFTGSAIYLLMIGSMLFMHFADSFTLQPQRRRPQQSPFGPPLYQDDPLLKPSSLPICIAGTRNRSTFLMGASSSRNSSMYTRRSGSGERTKRQERVGHVVQTELSRILHSGNIKGRDVEFLDDDLRQRISVVKSDLSPDLRQARISVSIRGRRHESRAVDRRRAYAWLIRNTKPIRHTLAQELKHMKTCPLLTFVEVDVSAAVDVMTLIDKVSSDSSYKRETLDLNDPESIPEGVVDGIDFDDEDLEDDDDWDDEDVDDFFNAEAVDSVKPKPRKGVVASMNRDEDMEDEDWDEDDEEDDDNDDEDDV